MKKILSWVLSLALVFSLTVPATAADFVAEPDKDTIQAGETVTVIVSLDETIPVETGVSALQFTLGYDDTILTVGTITPSEAYSYLPFKESSRKSAIIANWFDQDSKAAEFPAGTLLTVTFIADKSTSTEVLSADFDLSVKGSNAIGTEYPVNCSMTVSVTVCPGHSWTETGRTGSCTEDGEISYTCNVCGGTHTETVTATGHVHPGMADYQGEPVYDENWNIIEVTRYTCCDVCFEVLSSVTYTGVNLAIDENSELILPPVMNPSETSEIAPGESWGMYLNNFGGMVVMIYGEDITVSVSTPGNMWDPTLTTVEYTPIDGVVTIPVPTYAAFVTITNNGTEAASYPMEVYIPEGDAMNPIVGEPGENIIHVNADDQDGMYVEFTATCTGWVHITVSGDYWNFNTYYEGDPDDYEDDHYGWYYFDVPEDGDTDSIYMKAGETVRINLGSSYIVEGETFWDTEWFYPEADLTLTITPEYTHEGHVVHVEAVEPGCHFKGNVEHWYCVNCETVWTDAELTQVSNHNNVIVPELGGEVVHVEAKDPTCYEDGNIEHWYCETCEQVWQDEARTQLTNHKNVILGATGHQNIVHMEAVAPGCHYEGHVEHWYCVDCNTVWTDEALTQISNHMNVILPELGGDVVHVEAKDPTCTENGNIEHWYCESCEQVWQDEARTQLTNHKNVIVGAAGHVYGEDGVCTICGDNPKSGDTTISMAVAALIISAMSIVALPVVKKHF